MLTLTNIHVLVEGKPILRGVDLSICPGEVHVLMGPNGSGKTSLAMTLIGHPAYTVTEGEMRLLGGDLTGMGTHERAKNGLFVTFQSPVAVPGVSYFTFLRQSYQAITGQHVAVLPFKEKVEGVMESVGADRSLLQRFLNDGFSGGERKKMEIVQMMMLSPKVAVLDEIDSGLDVDSLKVVAKSILKLASRGSAILLITHNPRLLEYVTPSSVHVMKKGVIRQSGGSELIKTIEKRGYGEDGDGKSR